MWLDRTVLTRHSSSHPLLYMRGVHHTQLAAVIDFCYHGNVNIASEQLNSFLAIAEELKIKGLTQQQNCEPIKPTSESEVTKSNVSEQTRSTDKTRRGYSEWAHPSSGPSEQAAHHTVKVRFSNVSKASHFPI